jgi:uncharacterized membrane protein
MRQLHVTTRPGVKIVRSITINRTPEELFSYWRELENLPRIMTHLESVHVLDERNSRWVARAPAGRTVAWQAEIVEERPNELLAWRSSENSEIQNAGSVSFRPAPARRGTEVTVELEYVAPAGILGRAIARLFGEEPSQQLHDDLRRFKWVMESGEVPTAIEIRR